MDDLPLNDIAALDAAELRLLLIEQALHLAHVGAIRVVVIDVSVLSVLSVFVDVVLFWVYRWNGMFCVSLGDMCYLYRRRPVGVGDGACLGIRGAHVVDVGVVGHMVGLLIPVVVPNPVRCNCVVI